MLFWSLRPVTGVVISFSKYSVFVMERSWLKDLEELIRLFLSEDGNNKKEGICKNDNV